METVEDRKREFMVGLTKLTRETGIIICGCGCCSSPWLSGEDDILSDMRAGYGYGYADEVSWISPEDDYDWERYRNSIVRPSDTTCNPTK